MKGKKTALLCAENGCSHPPTDKCFTCNRMLCLAHQTKTGIGKSTVTVMCKNCASQNEGSRRMYMSIALGLSGLFILAIVGYIIYSQNS